MRFALRDRGPPTPLWEVKMIPTHPKEATLVDLVDRLLDKGLVLQADLIISMGEVPLIGIHLRAVIAGVETLLQYGIMSEYLQTARGKQHDQEHARSVQKIATNTL